MRRPTFRRLFELLEGRRQDSYTIVETGVAHLAAADGRPGFHAVHGQSTLLFDQFVNARGGAVYSVDCSPVHCRRARSWVSDRVRIFCHDSHTFLAGFSAPTPIDCLYLDSLAVDWSDPHPSALHHLEELCAILPRLPEGCIVVVDDTLRGIGKGGYIVEVMERIGARLLFEGYQVAWQLTGPPPAIRPWGCYAPDELAFVLARPAALSYRYVRVGSDERILELLPDGTIGHGKGELEERWFAERAAGGGVGLVLAGSGRITARLSPVPPEDRWRGHWLVHDREAVELWPLPPDDGVMPSGRYWLRAAEGGARPLGLLASHDVWNRGAGAETWRIERGEDGQPVLLLAAAGRDRWRFHPDREGCWQGSSTADPPVAASLELLGQTSDSEASARTALAARRLFRYRREGDGEWPIELVPDGTIGRGATPTEAAWDVEDTGDGELALLLYGRDSMAVRLAQQPDGSFLGKWPLHDRRTVRVEPLDRGSGAYLLPIFTACLPRRQIRRIVEVGGGDGVDAVALQRYFDADVMVFECNPDLLSACAKRAAACPRVTLVAKAAGEAEGMIPFYRVTNGNPHASSCFVANPAYPYEVYVQERCEVEMIRLDGFLDAQGPETPETIGLLAIDVQGGCLGVLRGLGAHLDRVRYVIAEIGTRPLYEGEALAPEVIAFLAGRGFHLLRWFDQWGVLPDGDLVDPTVFPRQYAGAESWFGDYLFVRNTPREAAAAAAITAHRFFRYVRLGHDERTLELLAGGQIGEGRGGCERNWIVEEQPDGAVELLLLGLEQVTCRLLHGPDGRWRGRWTSHERMPVFLEPLPAESQAGSQGACEEPSRVSLEV